MERELKNMFFCSTAKEHGVRQVGSLQCLNGKVDLSTHEARHTLNEWQNQLETLKQQLSVRSIAKEISAAKAPYTIKVHAYRNGDGRLRSPELIVSSSVPGVSSHAPFTKHFR